MAKKRKIGRHKSVPKDLKRAIKSLQNRNDVDRVILGTFYPCRHKHEVGSLEHRQDVGQGIKLYGYCGDGLCNLFVYLRDPDRREQFKEEMGL